MDQFQILPEDVYSQLAARAKRDPELERFGDISRGMAAGPALAGIMEAAKVRGGSGVNMNPLLAWASGLPGAPSNLGAIAKANPYVSPSDTIAKLMGMGEAAGQAQQQYLKERDKFFATQMGRPVGSAGVANALLKEQLINEPRRKEEREYREEQDRKRYDRERAEAKSEEEKKALDDAWAYVQDIKTRHRDEIGGIVEPMSRISTTLARAPKTGTVELDLTSFGFGKYEFPLNALKNWQTNPETAQFYSDVESILSEIRKSKYGATLTGFELDAALREFGLGKVTPIQTLFTRLDDIRRRNLEDIREEENLGRAKFGRNFDKFYTDRYGSKLRGINFKIQSKAPPKPKTSQKSPEANASPEDTLEGDLMQNLQDLEDAFN